MEKSAHFRSGRIGSWYNTSFPAVPITSVGEDTSMRAPLGMECNNTSPKTIEDYMR
jgi:hypothetical protein